MAAGELTRRWLVALVGVPAVVGLLWLGAWPLAVFVAVVAALGAGECYRLAEERQVRPLVWLGVPLAAALVLAAGDAPGAGTWAARALALIAATVPLALLAATFARGPEGRPLGAASVTLLGALYTGLALATVPLLHALPAEQGWAGPAEGRWAGVAAVALPLAATWIGDASAFFAGSAWGRHRLAPAISPKKSWEGAAAGLVGGAAGAAAWHALTRDVLPEGPVSSAWLAAPLGALLAAAAILGDLVESVLKREAGVKDSGRLLPGHGGVLDRVDALLFSLPVAYVVMVALGRSG